MPSTFWTRHNADAQTELTPKQPITEPLELEDGPRSPCNFMPHHSYLMMMSPAVHLGSNEANDGGGQTLVPDRDGTWWSFGCALTKIHECPDCTSTQFGNEEAGLLNRKVSRSVTTANLRDSTPTSEGFSEADTLVSEAGLLTKAPDQLYFHVPYTRFDIRLLFLFALLVAAFTLGWEGVSALGVKLQAYTLSALQMFSVAMEWSFEGIGYLIGRAVTRVVKGFIRGYHIE